MRSMTVSISVALLSMLTSGAVHGAKEKFVRSKPHVNVGTINAGVGERAVFSLGTVDDSREGDVDVLCKFLGQVVVSIPVATRLPDPSSPEASLSDFEELQTFDVLVEEGQLLQIALEPPASPTGPQPMQQAWRVEVIADERSTPVGVSCGLELGFHVFDPLTGESRVHTTWPEFAYDFPDRL